MTTASPPAPGDTWIETLVTHKAGPAVVVIDGRPHHAAAAASAAGGAEFGHIVVAMPVDQAFAQSVSEATQDDVILLSTNVLASTLRESENPWGSLQAWRESGGRQDQATDVTIGSRQFAAQEVLLSERPELAAIVAKSRDDAAAPFVHLQTTLLGIAAVCVAVAIAGAYWIARSV
jgi:hypothetical protein